MVNDNRLHSVQIMVPWIPCTQTSIVLCIEASIYFGSRVDLYSIELVSTLVLDRIESQ